MGKSPRAIGVSLCLISNRTAPAAAAKGTDAHASGNKQGTEDVFALLLDDHDPSTLPAPDGLLVSALIMSILPQVN